MRDKSALIEEQMEETRADLAEKLEQLEKKVTGTVESVTGLVEKVPETVETVKETIAETVSTVSDTVHHTVEAVKDTVEDTVESVKSFFDIPYQVDRHPWLVMGGSVLLGYLGGRLLLPRRHAAEPESSFAAIEPAQTPAYEPSYAPGAAAPEQTESSGPSWLSRLTERFGGEIDKVKGLALGSLFGVARDMISAWVPESLRQDVTEVVNNFTRDLGGKVIEGPVLGGGQDSSQQQEDGHISAGRQEAAGSAEFSSGGTTPRQGERSRR
jgi:hypothetical protein